jgi:hypothetical protein
MQTAQRSQAQVRVRAPIQRRAKRRPPNPRPPSFTIERIYQPHPERQIRALALLLGSALAPAQRARLESGAG